MKEIELGECQNLYPSISHLYYDKEICLYSKDHQIQLLKPTKFSQNLSEFLFGEIKIKIYVHKCIGKTRDGENCNELGEIQDFFNQNQIIINARNRLREFNARNKKLEYKPRSQLFLLGNDTVYFQQKYIKSTMQLDDGIILSNMTQKDYISDYTIETNFINNETFKQFAVVIDLGLQLEKNKIYIQYPKITEILPQVQSIFNTLCLFGIVMKFLSQALIVQDLVDNLLKYYYQKTNKAVVQQKKQNNMLKITNFKNLWWYFRQLYSGKQSREKFMKGDVFSRVLDQVKQNVELKNVFKELLELKTCVHFLLSKEQYAAIKKCGRDLPNMQFYQDQQTNFQNNKEQEENGAKIYDFEIFKRLNHIEKMDLIDQNEELQEQLFQKFKTQNQSQSLERIQNSFVYLDNLNSLIRECLVDNNPIKVIQEDRVRILNLEKEVIVSLNEQLGKEDSYSLKKENIELEENKQKQIEESEIESESVTDNVDSLCNTQRIGVKSFYSSNLEMVSSRYLKSNNNSNNNNVK